MIYLDHNATTPLDPEVRSVLEACQAEVFGNPSSQHAAGLQARRVLDDARARVASLIGAAPDEIVFTSGGTEANNIAILGAMASATPDRRRLVTTVIEHQAVLNPARYLQRLGTQVTFLPVNKQGQLDFSAAGDALDGSAALVSVMLANNDTGAIQPVAGVSALARASGAAIHSDAVQAAGKIPIDVNALDVDLLSFSAHKLFGPKGAGALYVRRGTELLPVLFGGQQERGMRPGTENVAAIAGFGKACELAKLRLDEDASRISRLRDMFEQLILLNIDCASVNCRGGPRLPNTTNICFHGIDGEQLALELNLLNVAVSTGAACSSSQHVPSRALLAMGRTPEDARSSLRFSLGHGTTADELEQAAAAVRSAVAALREVHR